MQRAQWLIVCAGTKRELNCQTRRKRCSALATRCYVVSGHRLKHESSSDIPVNASDCRLLQHCAEVVGAMQINKLRRAVSADAKSVRELSRTAYAKWVLLIGREPAPMTADYNRAVAEHIIDLLEVDGQLLALIEMIPQDDHLLIENIAVRPELQGKGLGGRLLDHAESVARMAGTEELRLYTNAAFESNIAFYEKRGYEEYGRETIAPGAAAVFMRKRISNSA